MKHNILRLPLKATQCIGFTTEQLTTQCIGFTTEQRRLYSVLVSQQKPIHCATQFIGLKPIHCVAFVLLWNQYIANKGNAMYWFHNRIKATLCIGFKQYIASPLFCCETNTRRRNVLVSQQNKGNAMYWFHNRIKATPVLVWNKHCNAFVLVVTTE